MSNITGVPVTDAAVQSTFQSVSSRCHRCRRSSSSAPRTSRRSRSWRSSSAASLSTIRRLSAKFFPGLNLSQPAGNYFASQANMNLVINPLIINTQITTTNGTQIVTQPQASAVTTELTSLITNLERRAEPGRAHRCRHDRRLRGRARQRRAHAAMMGFEETQAMIIRRKPPRQLGLKEPIRHPESPSTADAARFSRPRPHRGRRLHHGADVLQPVCESAQGLSGLANDIQHSRSGLRHLHAGRGQDPVHLLRPCGRREPEWFRGADRRPGRAARFSLGRRLRQSRAAGRHGAERAERRQPDATTSINTRSGSPGIRTARCCAAF